LKVSILFIADLHLNDQQPEIHQRFVDFLKSKAREARALYILGDLFEYYLGDDFQQGVIQQVVQELNQLVTQHQTECYFMAGNRDFLLSDDFAKSAQLTLLKDPTQIQLDENRIILCHGDHLCTDDVKYQKVRMQLRSQEWQDAFLKLNIQQRIEFAEQARIQSQKHTQSSNSEIMDVNSAAVEALFKEYSSSNFLLHGHTHRPAFHNLEINNISKQRMVVGDWHYQTSYIEYKNNSFQLVCC